MVGHQEKYPGTWVGGVGYPEVSPSSSPLSSDFSPAHLIGWPQQAATWQGSLGNTACRNQTHCFIEQRGEGPGTDLWTNRTRTCISLHTQSTRRTSSILYYSAFELFGLCRSKYSLRWYETLSMESQLMNVESQYTKWVRPTLKILANILCNISR